MVKSKKNTALELIKSKALQKLTTDKQRLFCIRYAEHKNGVRALRYNHREDGCARVAS